MVFAARMSGSFVIPLGSNRMCANFETHTSEGTPYCSSRDRRLLTLLFPAERAPSEMLGRRRAVLSPAVDAGHAWLRRFKCN